MHYFEDPAQTTTSLSKNTSDLSEQSPPFSLDVFDSLCVARHYYIVLTYQACGAAGTVTGSMHIFTYVYNGVTFRFGVDAGMFQTGEEMLEIIMNGNLVIDPKTVDAWILTHAHLDHSGRLPYVVKRGFSGPIYSSEATQDLSLIVMSDAVTQMRNKFREREEVEHELLQNGKLPEHSFERKDVELYNDSDVETTRSQFQTQKVNTPFNIHSNLEVEFFEASHILGSVYFRITEISTKKTLYSTADIGFSSKPYLPKVAKQQPDKHLTTLMLESTYGDRLHASTNPSEDLAFHMNAVLKKGGQVIIPTFAIQRAQELLAYSLELMEKGLIPKVMVYLDSPMAIQASEVYARYSQKAHEILANPRVKQTISSEQSKELNSITEPCIFLAGSGMMNGGRIWQHLRFHGVKSKNILLIVGFQAEGTYGREVMEGKREFEIGHKQISLKLPVVKIEGFSGHADQQMLVKWAKDLIPQTVFREQHAIDVFLVHGEDSARVALRDVLNTSLPKDSVSIHLPLQGQEFVIWKD